jgi:hypothetical protein
VIGLNLDRSRADAERFIAQQHLTWPQIAAAENPEMRALVAGLGITSIPKLLLIGSDGRLLNAAGSVDQLAFAPSGESASVTTISD